MWTWVGLMLVGVVLAAFLVFVSTFFPQRWPRR
jgi:hypothetical protein